MSKELSFFVYLLERYSEYKGIDSSDALKNFDRANLTEYIRQMYHLYHTERIENAFEDIDDKLFAKQSQSSVFF